MSNDILREHKDIYNPFTPDRESNMGKGEVDVRIDTTTQIIRVTGDLSGRMKGSGLKKLPQLIERLVLRYLAPYSYIAASIESPYMMGMEGTDVFGVFYYAESGGPAPGDDYRKAVEQAEDWLIKWARKNNVALTVQRATEPRATAMDERPWGALNDALRMVNAEIVI